MSEQKKELPAALEKQLMELGLTSYQARVYRAVFVLQECSISQIANYSKVPTAKIYSVVRDLKGMGLLAEVPTSRPVMYRAVSPDQYIQTEVNRVVEIGAQIQDNLKRLEKFRKDGIPKESQILLIENELLIKNLILKTLKSPPQEVFFVIHEDFDFYEQVLLRLDRAMRSSPELKISITILDLYERNLDEFLQTFKNLDVHVITKQEIPEDLISYVEEISFFFIVDEKSFIDITQGEQNVGYLFISSKSFSEFLSSILKNLKWNVKKSS